MEADQKKRSRAGAFFERNGVVARDIPLAIVAFKTAAFVTYFGLTVLGVRFRPINRMFHSGRPRRMIDRWKIRYPNFWGKAEDNVMKASEWTADFKFVQWSLSKYQTLQRSRSETMLNYSKRRRQDLGLGIAEGYIVYKLTLPIWASLYLYSILTYFSKTKNSFATIEESMVGSQMDDADPVTTEMQSWMPWNESSKADETASKKLNENTRKEVPSSGKTQPI